MDKIEKYREILKSVIKEYAKIKYANLDAQNFAVIDQEQDRYLVLTIGWKKYKRVHSCPIHFDIVDGKVVIQTDHTDYGIALDLMDAGIPKSDIVLGYYPAEKSEALGFAIV